VKKLIFAAIVCFAAAAAAISQTDGPTLFRDPSISKSEIVFSYGGDLWIVPRAGGDARRLTVGIGLETSPYFSPDGSMVAFTGEYDGNTDAYVVSSQGGVPRRLTYHPSVDVVSGWTPDGKSVLFSSTRESYAGFSRLYTMPINGGGLPSPVPLPMANRGSIRQARGSKPARNAANDDACLGADLEANLPQAGSPANDNPSIDNLPTCLEVTDEEVRLLGRYLGPQILALFG